MIRDDATQRQVDAANPNMSTWLSANAGSGKTRVLTDRVARLLLNETRPENILCLTYTKAAASEMQNRLFKRLGEWAMMPAPELRKELEELGIDADLDTTYVARARTLFASAIETPGGLKIQTIHSFCSGILRRFPLEAKVSPNFREMEDRAAKLLRAEVLDAMADGEDASALAGFANHFTGADVDKFLAEIAGKKQVFVQTPADDRFWSGLGCQQPLDESCVLDAVFLGDEATILKQLSEVCAQSGVSDQKAAEAISRINISTPFSLSDLEVLENVLLTGSGTKEPFTAKIGKFPTKAVREANPNLIDKLEPLMLRVEATRQDRLTLAAFQKTKALFAFAKPFLDHYEARKLARGALDFDDLINKAKALLADPAVAQWVLFRLDGGVDHVLVDEAQDTSPDQWEIIRLLTQEFATGEGAQPDRERTIFVVGDKKQSIYSFQGADPKGFDRMRDHFGNELQKIDKKLQTTELEYSFRSSPAILSLVDEVFRGQMAEGLDTHINHLAFNMDMPGRVDLWPVIEKLDKPEDRAWDDPVDLKGQTNHQVILADRIAQEIKRMIDQETLPFKPKGSDSWQRRPITPGDFLILVQSRTNGVFEDVIAACKKAGLDVAGADRLKLGGELAVKDVTALLQFLALQEDDLSLAAALKSPLFGWTEKDLYRLAQPRADGQTLWEALRRSSDYPKTIAILSDLRNQSDFLRPYDLINRVLLRHGGRQALLARLGHEAEDGIDALLAQALSYEQSDIPSLTGFLTWLQTEDVTVKRQMDSAGDRIRVMTVHGAKGLEAPIVILPDTTKRKRELKSDLLDGHGTLHWKPKADVMPAVLDTAKETALVAQDEERRRLLYVALTRAESWLIVAAAGELGKEPTESWHGMVDVALSHLDTIDHPAGFGPIKRFSRGNWDAGADAKPEEPTPVLPVAVTFGDVLPDLPVIQKPLSPSGLGGQKILPGDTDEDESDAALAFGRLAHLLLEKLPQIAPNERAQVGRSMIENQPDAGLVEDPEALLNEVLDVLNDPNLAHIFEDALVEVPISANLPGLGGRRISGLIDRLIITGDIVTAIDFKTNRITPDHPQQTPSGLKRQMAAYRDALRQIYPNHRIHSVLLWTKTRTLTELPDADLDGALKDVSVS